MFWLTYKIIIVIITLAMMAQGLKRINRYHILVYILFLIPAISHILFLIVIFNLVKGGLKDGKTKS